MTEETTLGKIHWVLFDGNCGFCRKWVGLWNSTLEKHGFKTAALQEDWVRESLALSDQELLHDIRLLTSDGARIQGADVYRFVMRRIWWMWPFYVLSCLPGLRQCFDGVYRLVAQHRHKISGTCELQ